MDEKTPTCAKCPHHWSKRLCNSEDGKSLANCPTIHKKEVLKEAMRLYEDPETLRFACSASIQEAEGYETLEDGRVRPTNPRLFEVAEFAKKMNYQRLGLIFCEGVYEEARVVDKYLNSKGFDVVSIACKAGRTPKEDIGVRDDQKITPGTFESMCNPIYQACIVNDAEVEFNVIMGLCVGHDSLVIQHLKAPVTILAAKDRVMGHNPMAAVYNLDSYCAYMK